jgi:probable HAF family extracellular repeat protein
MQKVASTIFLLSLLVAPCFAQYNFTTVDFPGAAQTEVIAVNDAGHYVGASIDASGTNHAIFFDGKSLSLLDPDGVVGTNFSFALSLNLCGDIVGGYVDSANVSHGFLYNGGNATPIDFPGASGTFAFGINDLREIIGVYADASQNQHAFLLRNGVFKNIDLAGGVLTVPFSVNDLGEIVGQFENAPGESEGHGYFELSDGKFTTFDAPGAPPNRTFFISINNVQQILGTWVDASAINHNFLLAGKNLRNFNLPNSLHAANVSAQTLNDFGEIVGFYFDAQQVQHGFLAIPKNETGTH